MIYQGEGKGGESRKEGGKEISNFSILHLSDIFTFFCRRKRGGLYGKGEGKAILSPFFQSFVIFCSEKKKKEEGKKKEAFPRKKGRGKERI